jgi:hypothetical protein
MIFKFIFERMSEINTECLKRPNELNKDYRLRLYKNQDAYGLSNKEIGDLCNEAFAVNYDESAHRKYVKPYLDGYNDAILECGSESEKVKSLIEEHKLVEENIRKERYKLQATKLERDRQDRQDGRFELFYENVRDAIITLPLPEIKSYTIERNNDDEYVILIADIHFGAKFKSAHNEYSIEIVKQRFSKLLSELIVLIEEKHLKKLTILGLGDDIQGLLRLTDLLINQIPVVNAVVEFPRIMASFLNELSAYCDIDFYPVQNSNHSQTRPIGTKASELAGEDLEKVIVNHIYDMLINNPRVNVHIEFEDKPIILDVKGFKCIAKHGHQLKSANDNVLKDLSDFYRVFFDYAFLGHFHAGKESVVGAGDINNRDVIVADGFIGSDPYSDSLYKDCKGAVKVCKFTKNGYTGYDKIIFD